MAEGVVGAVLGGEPEQAPEGGDAALSSGLDPAAAAAAMEAAKSDPALAERAGAYFEEQTRLVRLQTEHLHEQRQVVLANLKLRWQAERLKIGLQIFLILALLPIAVGLLAMIYGAVTSRSVVVEPFNAPPALAAQGLSGEVAARDIAARLAAIGRLANAHSIAHSDEARADTTTPVKLEIPETGVSPEELRRFLHLWLGHERHISGDLRSEASDQIVVTIRLDGADPIVVRGPAADADALMQTAAERAFAVLDPVNSVIYLWAKGRQPEAAAAAENLALHNPGTVSPAEAYSLWADVDRDRARAARSAEIATSLGPRFMTVWMEAMYAAHDLGHSEAELTFARRVLTTRQGDQPPEFRGGYGLVMNQARTWAADDLGDFIQPRAPTTLVQSDVAANLEAGAEQAFRDHDAALGRRLYARMTMAGGIDPTRDLQLRWLAAANTGDWAAAKTVAEALVAAQTAAPASAKKIADGQTDLELATLYQPELALALAETGDAARATALIASTPTDCYFCLRVRARVAAASGDAAQADRWFAEAVRQGPSLPFALAEWGDALAARGALAQAMDKYAAAHAKGPRWADPLKAWGDLLARQGRRTEALTKYDEALEYAPAWSELRQARDAAAKARP